jgi:hypothetical protein
VRSAAGLHENAGSCDSRQLNKLAACDFAQRSLLDVFASVPERFRNM